MSNFKLLSLVTASVLALAACGGGGGASTANNVSLSGTAAKGILIGADVKVYALVNGVKGTTPLATTTTNANGEYVLSLAPTSNPLLIEVTANANTKMLDETGTLTADGKYPEVAAPTNLSLRSFATEATKTTEVRVNPLTEMAIAVAASSGGLTLNNLVAGQEVAKLAAPEGVNPFTQTPVAKPADMDDAQMKFAMQMAGLLASAGGSCELKCQIDKLSEGVAITVANDGKATVPPAINAVIQQKKRDVLDLGQTALKVDTASETKKANIATAVVAAANQAVSDAKKEDAAPVTTPDTETVIAANGLKGFVTALRDGFRLTEQRLLKVEEELTKRYETVTLDGVNFAGTVLNGVESDCKAPEEGVIQCKTSDTSRFNWTGSGSTYNWASKAPDDLGRTTTGTVVFGTQSGVESFTLNGSIKKGSATLLTMTNVSVALEDRDYNDFKAAISGLIQANDSTSGSATNVSLQLTDLLFESVPKSTSQDLECLT